MGSVLVNEVNVDSQSVEQNLWKVKLMKLRNGIRNIFNNKHKYSKICIVVKYIIRMGKEF